MDCGGIEISPAIETGCDDLKWKPGDDYVVRFKDKSDDEPRSEETLNKMVEKMGEVAHDYDFGLSEYASFRAMAHSFAIEVAFSDKLRQKYGE